MSNEKKVQVMRGIFAYEGVVQREPVAGELAEWNDPELADALIITGIKVPEWIPDVGEEVRVDGRRGVLREIVPLLLCRVDLGDQVCDIKLDALSPIPPFDPLTRAQWEAVVGALESVRYVEGSRPWASIAREAIEKAVRTQEDQTDA